MTPDWLTAIGTLAAAVVALVVAVFHKHLSSLFWRPVLSIVVENRPPDCHLTTLTNLQTGVQAPCYYFRLRVHNNGNASAETVEVFIEEIQRRRADGTFETWQGFLPLNLRWAHYGTPYFPQIPPRVYKHCDLGHIVDPSMRQQFPGEDYPPLGIPAAETLICLDLVVKPATRTYLIPRGVYRLVLVAAAANAHLVRRTIEMNLTGQWFADEDRMFREGIGFTTL
jgi:hypothetical protein